MAFRRLCYVLVLLINLTVILKSVKGNSNQITSSNDRATDWESYESYVQVKAERNAKEHLCLKWIVSQDRLYHRHVGFGVGNGFVLDFEGNKSCSSLALYLILLLGNVSPNPGPLNYPCKIGKKNTQKNQKRLYCNACRLWFHVRPCCLQMAEGTYNTEKGKDDWTCVSCKPRDGYSMSPPLTSEQFDKIKRDLSVPGLKICHLNVDRLLYRFAEVKQLLHETRLDILAIIETKLDSNTSDSEVNVDGCITARKDRNKHGGGVLIYYRDNIISHNEDKFGKRQELEALWINICCQSQTWLIDCVYQPPDKHSFYIIFDDVLAKIWMKRKNIVILGDLNSDLLMKGKSKEYKYLGRRLLKILNLYDLKNVINQPTQIAEKTQTIIDVIIASSPEKITVKGISHLGISDHSLVYANIRARKDRAQLVFTTVNSYKNFNSDKFGKEVESAPCGVSNVFDDIEDQVWAWEYLFKEIYKDHISQKKINIKTKPLPWITSSIKKEQNKCYKLLSEFRQTKDKKTWEKYKQNAGKQTRNKVKKLSREAELSYWKQEFAKAETIKDFWKVVNKAQGQIKSKVIGTIVNKDGDILTSDKEKTESINKYFTSIGQELAS